MAKHTLTEFGSRLLEARNAGGLSQQKLAESSGVSQTTIANLESGRNSGETYIFSIADVLGVDARWLALGEGSPPAKHPASGEISLRTPMDKPLTKGLTPEALAAVISVMNDAKSEADVAFDAFEHLRALLLTIDEYATPSEGSKVDLLRIRRLATLGGDYATLLRDLKGETSGDYESDITRIEAEIDDANHS